MSGKISREVKKLSVSKEVMKVVNNKISKYERKIRKIHTVYV